ncbi:Transcriptional antiterminator [Pelosinus fermentans]|uniref:BglG family transcription antiterminator n=1 Tax=Pelosinus fermentans TaxID=365349 RepID=UPI00026852F8|nr:PRD domain-containing protein [Pelosinus fermentans]OAM96341.1 transcriptional antiterminator, BglG [Pelosinus fermentans DSM 17108]SDR39087.1 Transcriptional antiterminator [Pelosinus fermentans]
MAIFNLRQKELIRLLIAENDFKPIKYYSGILKVSDKTLSKDINFIENYLKNKNIKINRKPGSGIRIKIVTHQKMDLLNDINANLEAVDPLSIKNRRIETLKLLLTQSNQNTSIQKLADAYYVSKASIANDLKFIEDWLQSYDITLDRSVEGTKINGSEVNIRKAIASITSELLNDTSDSLDVECLSRLDSQTIKGLSKIFDLDLVLYIEKILIDLEKTLEYTIGDPYFINLLTHILICIKRVSDGNQIQGQNNSSFTFLSADDAISESAAKLALKIYEKCKIKINDSEIYYIYQYLVSCGVGQRLLGNSLVIKKDLEVNYIDITASLVKMVSDILTFDLTKDTLLHDGLILHIRPMLNRLKYNIQIKNPLLKEIEERFTEMLSICQIVVHLITLKYNLNTISIDEIGYLVTYFQAAIEREISYKKVIVVCHSGYGTSQLLTTRLRRAFPQWQIGDVISEHKLNTINLDDIDFIISTVHLAIKEKPYMLVSALLNEKDIKNIKNILIEDSFENTKQDLQLENLEKLNSAADIYINTEDAVIINDLEKNNAHKLVFYKVDFGKKIQIYLAGNSNIKRLAIQIVNNTEGSSCIKFFILNSDYEHAKNIVMEIYHLYEAKNAMNYLLECTRAIDVQRFFMKN